MLLVAVLLLGLTVLGGWCWHMALSSAAVSPTTKMELVRVPAGEFQMGSPNSDGEADDHEKPQHRVRITRAFYLGVYPVTQEQYQKVMGVNPSSFSNQPKNPVEQVSWFDAVTFCNQLSEREKLSPYYQISGTDVTIPDRNGNGYRLPTEAEWEYACRAGSETKYFFGDNAADLDKYAWYAQNSDWTTHRVGQKLANPFGLHDMHGNVREWCWDGYDDRYYDHSLIDDPAGLLQASARVVRNGSWKHDPQDCRSAHRERYTPETRRYLLGFRVARSTPS